MNTGTAKCKDSSKNAKYYRCVISVFGAQNGMTGMDEYLDLPHVNITVVFRGVDPMNWALQ